MNELAILSSGFEDMGWPEGRYVDKWTIPHFLCGVGIGIATSALKIRYPTDWIIGTTIIVGWEIYEHFVPPKEYLENHIVDTIVGLGGFGLIKLFVH